LTLPRHLAPLFAAATLFCLLLTAACGGSSSSDGRPPEAPDGWVKFEQGAWSGWIDPNWRAVQIDSTSVKDPTVLTQLPEASRASIQRVFESGRISDVTFVFFDPTSAASPFINLLGCFAESETTPNDKIVETYASVGVTAVVRGETRFQGRDWNVAKVTSGSTDIYQLFPKVKDCYLALSLTTAAGDENEIGAFRRFITLLDVDTSKLPQ
jgi:hypothetical protein